MTAKLSPLQLTDFQLLDLQYQFINPVETDEVDTGELFSRYDIDVDFAIQPQDDANFTIFTKAGINQSGSEPGYKLFAEGVSTFRITDPAALPETTLQNLLVFSGVGIAMQQLRSRIADLTSFAPFGKYMLPTLDVDDLLKRKREQREQTVAQKSRHKKQNQISTDPNAHLPNTAVFKALIQKILKKAQDQGLPFIDLNAGDLHREAGGGSGKEGRVPICCNAMRNAMIPGDEILFEPPKGSGTSVKIRYKLPR